MQEEKWQGKKAKLILSLLLIQKKKKKSLAQAGVSSFKLNQLQLGEKSNSLQEFYWSLRKKNCQEGAKAPPPAILSRALAVYQ